MEHFITCPHGSKLHPVCFCFLLFSLFWGVGVKPNGAQEATLSSVFRSCSPVCSEKYVVLEIKPESPVCAYALPLKIKPEPPICAYALPLTCLTHPVLILFLPLPSSETIMVLIRKKKSKNCTVFIIWVQLSIAIMVLTCYEKLLFVCCANYINESYHKMYRNIMYMNVICGQIDYPLDSWNISPENRWTTIEASFIFTEEFQKAENWKAKPVLRVWKQV